ncbi:putative lambda repressor-like DNA-binding protein [Rhizobium phage RHph_N65]|nr:putative lambda repressor-like DNA-binding protein [Rhizobium phage RHph_N65]
MSVDGRANNGRSPGHSGYALPGTKKPARTSIRIVKALFDIIDDTGLSAERIAATCGLHHVSLSRWKHGHSAPNLAEFENAAQSLGYRLVLEKVESPSSVSDLASNSA